MELVNNCVIIRKNSSITNTLDRHYAYKQANVSLVTQGENEMNILKLLSSDRELVTKAENCCQLVIKENIKKLFGDDDHLTNILSKEVNEFHQLAVKKFPELKETTLEHKMYYKEIIKPLGEINIY